MPRGIYPIFTNQIATGGSLVLNNIPQTFTDLVLYASIRDNTSGGGAGQTLYMDFNGDGATNYSSRWMETNGSSAYTSSNQNQTGFRVSVVNSQGATASSYGSMTIYIPNYRSNVYKSFTCEYATENNATAIFNGLGTGTWRNFSPITRIGLGTGFQILQFTSISLYGISNT